MNLETLAPGPGPLSMMRNPNQITGIILEEFRRFGWTLITNWTSIGQYFFFLILFTQFFFISLMN